MKWFNPEKLRVGCQGSLVRSTISQHAYLTAYRPSWQAVPQPALYILSQCSSIYLSSPRTQFNGYKCIFYAYVVYGVVFTAI